MYYQGTGVPQDYKEAVRLYRLSAEQGLALGQYNLGAMYSEGKGVPQDYILAYMWYILSASSGWEVAVNYRNILEKQMSPQQIEKAQELVRNWKPNNKIRTAESPRPKPSTPQPPKSKESAISLGTRFLFGSQDYIVTNYHVVKGTSASNCKVLKWGSPLDADSNCKRHSKRCCHS